MNRKVGYIGFSDEMLRKIGEFQCLELIMVFCDENRISSQICRTAEALGVPIVPINSSKDIYSYMQRETVDIDLFIIYKSSIIIKKDLIEKYSFYNFHLGSLKSNRGAHSLTWSILLGEKNSMMSLHKVTLKIDVGLLIDCYEVAINEDYGTKALENSLEVGVEKLLISLIRFLDGDIDGSLVNDGIYRRKIIEADYTIDLSTDDETIIRNKINSQKDYRGAVINLDGNKFYCERYIKSEPVSVEGNWYGVENNFLRVVQERREYIFELRC